MRPGTASPAETMGGKRGRGEEEGEEEGGKDAGERLLVHAGTAIARLQPGSGAVAR